MPILPKELFEEPERVLQHEIKNNNDPFLGMFADYLTEETERELIKYIQSTYDPVKTYTENSYVYSALLSTLLVKSLLHDFGATGHFAVYPIIKKIIGVSLSEREKVKLWKSFRHACLLLGLPVSSRLSGTHYMVQEYLRQAGLPLRYADRFAEKALNLASQVGLPEEEDIEALGTWQQSLIHRLKNPFPKVAREAIVNDEGCYYSSVFLRLFNSQPINDYSNLPLVEQEIAKVIINGPSRKTKKVSIPQILIKDLEYGLLLPGSDSSWTIKIDGETSCYNSAMQESFIPFSDSLVQKAKVQSLTGNQWEFQLWEDQQPNRLLIFSKETGKLLQNASLTDKEILLKPGDYLLILRFMPVQDEQTELFSEELSLYAKHISLNPGGRYELKRGPVSLSFKADDIPVMQFTNDAVHGIKGNEFISSWLLGVDIYLPDEFLEITREYVLLLKSETLGEQIEISFLVEESNKVTIDLMPYLKSWKSGVARFVSEISRKDSKRVISRQSVILWNGLRSVEKRVVFYCDKMPENLDHDRSENVKVDTDRHIVTYQDATRRLFKMYFKDGRIERHFTWTVPGIFLNLQTFLQGTMEERSLRLGMRLSVNRTARKNLQIYASNPSILMLGKFNSKVDFSRVGSKIIPLASLLEYATAGNSTLLLIDKETNEEVPLVELVTPSTIEDYKVESGLGVRTISFSSLDHINGFRVTAKNLITGDHFSAEFERDENTGPKRDELMPGINFKSTFFSQNKLELIIPEKGWPPGFWLLYFYIKVGSIWRITTNANNEIIADSLLKSEEQFATKPNEVFQAFEEQTTINELEVLFSNIHDALMIRYGQECWRNVSWLKPYWLNICIRYFRKINDSLLWSSLLRVSTEWPDEAIAEGHVPTSLLSGTLLNMYCFERSVLNVKPNNTSMLACMNFFPKMGDISALFENNEIDLSVLFGFENAARVQAGAVPNDFVMDKYKEAFAGMSGDGYELLDDDWLPAAGTFLSPLHYRYAVRRLVKRYTRSLSVESGRRGRMLGLIQQMTGSKLSSFINSERYDHLVDHIDLGLFTEQQDEMFLNEETVVQQEHQQKIIHFLSLLAQVCRAEVHRGGEGALYAFLQDIKHKCNLSGNHIQNHLGYLIFIGEDVFAFYLMLWELIFTADIDTTRRIVTNPNTQSAPRSTRRIYVRN